jgi:hypothetical protein
MIEFTPLELLLLIVNMIFLFMNHKTATSNKEREVAMAAILHGLHIGKLKIVEIDNGLKVELV